MLPLLLLMLAALMLVLAAAILLMAHSILRPPRMTDGKALYLLKRLSPDDLGIAYEPMTFEVRDPVDHRTLKLAAWWMAHPTGGDKTVVLIHGYADAKVGAIAWAPTWRALGYHILAIDLRAHGQSEGRYTTAGVRERHDLDQVINQLKASKPNQTGHVVLFGVSLGAAIALATAALRDDLAGLVLESPIAHFRNGVRTHAELLDLPLPSLLPVVIRVGKWLSGSDFDQIDPVELIKHVKCPVLAIQSSDDPFLPPEDALAIEQAVAARGDASAIWRVENVSHLMALSADPNAYGARIKRFLESLA